MPVTEGNLPGQWPVSIDFVADGEPANQTVINRPTIQVDNRTQAVRTLAEDQEVLRDAQLGSSDIAIGGVQGTINTAQDTFNSDHAHTGLDGSTVIDLQDAYDNGVADAVIKLESGGSLEFQDSSSATLLKIDEATGHITGNVGTLSADVLYDGSTNAAVTLAEETAWNTHLTAINQHSHKYMGFPLQMANVAVSGNSWGVSTQMSGQTSGGSDGVEGVVTNPSHNYVIIRNANSDDIVDAGGNKVYGRITYVDPFWTLSFFSNYDGTETAYSFSGSTTIQWWVQKIYAPASRPVYSPMFEVASDQIAGTINWSTFDTDITPDIDNSRKLGTVSKRWKDVYVSEEVGVGSAVVNYDATKGISVFKGNGYAVAGEMTPVGATIPYVGLTAPAGWLLANSLTIGDASSGSTSRANADTWNLFNLLWAWTNAVLPIYTSAGGASTRGVSAVSDFAAHKRLSLPDLIGRTPIGMDSAGLRMTQINGAVIGSSGGEQTHQLTEAELASHDHGITDPGHVHSIPTHEGDNAASNTVNGDTSPNTHTASTSSHTTGITINNAGGDTAHNNVQPGIILNYIIKY